MSVPHPERKLYVAEERGQDQAVSVLMCPDLDGDCYNKFDSREFSRSRTVL
ncbi:hypothetical protein J5X98_22340 [Leptothermofonsia sichuanensis E412]|uniref:hypothetical protein n=1 Tax=Leptothermofonsia sichuanensis TaxID=2917832 RepID=UPI001CA61641|nr:hypothetical protein [Leptothermofonsia sichuanensis]QZZ20004.1 hypothetical protein J5X98_22340 [Leptothermofonsia sichuanensis E412]